MKTHEFASQLEKLAHLLLSLPDTELDQNLNDLLGTYGKNRNDIKEKRPIINQLPDGFEDRLRAMSPAGIETYLASEEANLNTTQLSALAERLGLTTSKRQSKSALVNLITRYFEAGQMSSIIRGIRDINS